MRSKRDSPADEIERVIGARSASSLLADEYNDEATPGSISALGHYVRTI